MGAREMAPKLPAVTRPAPQMSCEARAPFWAMAVPRDARVVRDPAMTVWLAPLHQCVLVPANAVDERPTDPWVFKPARDALGRAGVPKKLAEPRVPLCHTAAPL